jgi:predicted nucleotidyltransferase
VTYFGQVLTLLASAEIEFILVGGVAANVHGSVRATDDLDLVYRRTPGNLARLAAAFAPLRPSLRGAPEGLPFRFDQPTLKAGLNFTLNTSLGAVDLLGEISGGGGYDQLLPNSEVVEMFGISCRVLDLATLIATKKAAGRPKDLDAIAELKTIRDRR